MTQFKPLVWQSTETDSRQILDFLSEIALHPAFLADFHQGDFCWQFWRGFDRTFEDSILRIVREDGSLVAIGWFDPPDELEISIHPALFDSADYPVLPNMLLDWAEDAYARIRQPDDKPLGVTVLDANQYLQDVLAARGYRADEEPWLAANVQNLDYAIPHTPLPDGYSFVAMTDEANFAERVDVHREVWNPSKLVLEGYTQLRTSPAYDPGLDLVVCGTDGRYVANVHGWYDPVSRIGLLEPVGCREAYRGRGLTGALVREVLRRFQERGATHAWVGSEPSEVPATALYRSTGFQEIGRYYQWTRPDH